MGTIAEKLSYLNETKAAIKAAIEAKGATLGSDATFRSFASAISNIDTGGDVRCGVMSLNGSQETEIVFDRPLKSAPGVIIVARTSSSAGFSSYADMVTVSVPSTAPRIFATVNKDYRSLFVYGVTNNNNMAVFDQRAMDTNQGTGIARATSTGFSYTPPTGGYGTYVWVAIGANEL